MWSTRTRKGHATTRLALQSTRGYPTFSPRGVKTTYVHQVVARTFLGPRPAGYETRHLDGNKTNNHVSNLAYGTSAENKADSKRHGTNNAGERNGVARLTDMDVRWMRVYSAMGFSYTALALCFGVSLTPAWNAINGKTWAHVPFSLVSTNYVD